MNISTRDLDAFLALAQTQHFTRAAERCHLSQSAFSQKISRIEAAAGLRLFERSTRLVTLTPEGEVFVEEARRIRSDLRQALIGLQDLAQRRIGRVAVAVLPSVAAEWMPAVIARYRAANPRIKVELFDSLASTCISMLRDGRVDIAITAGEELQEFDCQVLRRERYFLVCRDDHPLAPRRSVTLAQAMGSDMMHLARSSSVRQHLQGQQGVSDAPVDGLEVEHLATLSALIAQGLGVSVVPELTLFHFRRDRLRAIPIRDPQLRRPIVLARPKGKALSIAAQAMVEEVLAQARA
ncbi:LysR family transcriptional regulator [Hydrogenophaga sp.]